MTQLILDIEENNVQLPESKRGGYTVTKEPLTSAVQMISGRTVREVRGDVYVISYQYGYLSEEMKNRFLAACDKGVRTPILCSFLPQDSTEALTTDYFWVTEATRPHFMWSKDGKPLWGNFAVTLRGVRPID